MFKKNLYFFVLISLFLLCFFTGCKEEVNSAFYLDNYWQWDVGADDGTMPDSIITGQGLKKLAIHQEKNLENAFEDKKGYVWLRADFILPEDSSKRIFNSLWISKSKRQKYSNTKNLDKLCGKYFF